MHKHDSKAVDLTIVYYVIEQNSLETNRMLVYVWMFLQSVIL